MKVAEIKCENPSLSQLNELVHMVSEAFHYPEGGRISEDFPLLYEENNISHLWTIAEKKDGKTVLAAHAGCLPQTLYIDGHKLPVGGIGGVASHEDFRGKGYAKGLVMKCVEDLKQSGACIAFLWSGEHDFYRSMGFELVAQQWSIPIPIKKGILLKKEGETLFEKKGVSLDSLKVITDKNFISKQGKSLLDKHCLRVERDQKKFSKLILSPGAQTFGLVSEKNLLAYVVVGKGIDLKNHIHEWAGASEALLYLVGEVSQLQKESLTLLTPQFTPEEAPWIYALEKLGLQAEMGCMALVKLLNFEKIRELLIKKVKSMAMESSFIRLEKLAEDKFCIGWATDPDIYLNEAELLKILFGPLLPSQQVELPNESKHALDALLPLRLWWWGLDSV